MIVYLLPSLFVISNYSSNLNSPFIFKFSNNQFKLRIRLPALQEVSESTVYKDS